LTSLTLTARIPAPSPAAPSPTLSVGSDPFVLHREHIDRAIAGVCRRHALIGQDAEDFASDVRLFLLDKDRAALRAFEGRSSIATYLVAVVAHRLQDWRNARWGKWRPSAEAKRLGPLAVKLETLLIRDGLSLDAAYETLRSRAAIHETRADLEAIAARFPNRTGRTYTSDDTLEDQPAPDPSPDRWLEESRAGDAGSRASDALRAVLARLPAEDRLLLRMRFDNALKVSDIARAMGLDQKALYRRFEHLLTELRDALEEAGITRTDAQAILAYGGFDRVPEHRLPELQA
jgi:RNA polymerase sigma factor (sigma-70 family)